MFTNNQNAWHERNWNAHRGMDCTLHMHTHIVYTLQGRYLKRTLYACATMAWLWRLSIQQFSSRWTHGHTTAAWLTCLDNKRTQSICALICVLIPRKLVSNFPECIELKRQRRRRRQRHTAPLSKEEWTRMQIFVYSQYKHTHTHRVSWCVSRFMWKMVALLVWLIPRPFQLAIDKSIGC